MKRRRLGSSDLEVSVISLGCWQLASSDYWGPSGEAEDAVRAALDHGINLFDVAEGYVGGESEAVLGRALGAERARALIATKVSSNHLAADDVRKACEESLRRLNTDYIDLLQVHWPSRSIPFADTAEALQSLKDAGKIREIGVSNFGSPDIEAWMAAGTAASNQLGYNLLFRAIEFDIVPACRRHGIGILAYMPLLQGILAGRWRTIEEIPVPRRRVRHFSCEREGVRHGEAGHEELLLAALEGIRACADEHGCSMAALAVAWAMAQPQIASVIVGCRKPDQIEQNLAAGDLVLDDATLQRLDSLSLPLKASMGPNADMWQGGDQSRIR